VPYKKLSWHLTVDSPVPAKKDIYFSILDGTRLADSQVPANRQSGASQTEILLIFG